ncbi:hypothetical protein QBC39DRAFT_23121 [Podospora conica]|nr:hypothetical protein QBC39DRAFT_23121 [Schizothecium conicum]
MPGNRHPTEFPRRRVLHILIPHYLSMSPCAPQHPAALHPRSLGPMPLLLNSPFTSSACPMTRGATCALAPTTHSVAHLEHIETKAGLCLSARTDGTLSAHQPPPLEPVVFPMAPVGGPTMYSISVDEDLFVDGPVNCTCVMSFVKVPAHLTLSPPRYVEVFVQLDARIYPLPAAVTVVNLQVTHIRGDDLPNVDILDKLPEFNATSCSPCLAPLPCSPCLAPAPLVRTLHPFTLTSTKRP